MLKIATALALLAITAPALADAALDHRVWVAEQIIQRLTNRLTKLAPICRYAQRSEDCKTPIENLHPVLKIIREVAASGDDVKWAKVLDVVHKLEADTEPGLNALSALERK